ncbi:hypothetical protein [Nocardia asiatica]|uniref:hypothetical protein n=1 Tax=Nocardia asiatica TaxID=209252 RepID=UPI001FE01B4F|nr:hypothetical protein [Nocardia asiatica]
MTGFVSPRYVGDGYDVFGEATLLVLPTINHEAVAAGRERVARRLKEAITQACEDRTNESRKKIFLEISEDDVGVSRWYAFWEGSFEREMQMLKMHDVSLWRRFVRGSANRA